MVALKCTKGLRCEQQYKICFPNVLLGNYNNKPHSLMSDPASTIYFHNMSCDLSNKILFKAFFFKFEHWFAGIKFQ